MRVLSSIDVYFYPIIAISKGKAMSKILITLIIDGFRLAGVILQLFDFIFGK